MNTMSIIATVITLALSIIWLRLNDFAAHRGWIESRDSRKIIHIGTGPIFVLCWLIYPGLPYDRFLAALVPLLITAQFVMVGTGVMKDEAAVKAMSRSGDRREILRGPLYYGIVFVVITVMFWLESPIGIVALMLVCGGDGLAEVMGRRLGKTKLPWSKNKTYMGSLGMFLGGWLLAAFVVGIYVAVGVFSGPFTKYLLPLTWIALVATAVEAVSPPDSDNLTIAAAGLVMGFLAL
jgi:phytol kinase